MLQAALAQVPDPLHVKVDGGTDWVALVAVIVAALGLVVALVTVWRQNNTTRVVSGNTIAA